MQVNSLLKSPKRLHFPWENDFKLAMQHIFHLKEHLSSRGGLLSLSFQWKLFKWSLRMIGEQSGKLMTFQRQKRQLLWRYSSNTGESNWLSAVWKHSSANNSHLIHHNKVVVTAWEENGVLFLFSPWQCEKV